MFRPGAPCSHMPRIPERSPFSSLPPRGGVEKSVLAFLGGGATQSHPPVPQAPPPKARTLSTPPQGGSDRRGSAPCRVRRSIHRCVSTDPPWHPSPLPRTPSVTPGSHMPRIPERSPFSSSPLAGESRKTSSLFSEGGLRKVIRRSPKPPPPKARTLSTPPQGGSDRKGSAPCRVRRSIHRCVSTHPPWHPSPLPRTPSVTPGSHMPRIPERSPFSSLPPRGGVEKSVLAFLGGGATQSHPPVPQAPPPKARTLSTPPQGGSDRKGAPYPRAHPLRVPCRIHRCVSMRTRASLGGRLALPTRRKARNPGTVGESETGLVGDGLVPSWRAPTGTLAVRLRELLCFDEFVGAFNTGGDKPHMR